MNANTSKKSLILPLLIAAIALAIGVWANSALQRSEAQDTNIEGFLWPNPKTLTPFRITDDQGQPFDLSRLRDKWTFLFFGYTHCPDVCPGTLGMLDQVARKLDADPVFKERVQFVFVSVDPERDTPEFLAAYVRHFNPNFIGATDSDAYLSSLTRQLGIVYMANPKDANGAYTVDHTASILLVSPDAQLVGVFGVPHDPADILRRFIAMHRVVTRG